MRPAARTRNAVRRLPNGHIDGRPAQERDQYWLGRGDEAAHISATGTLARSQVRRTMRRAETTVPSVFLMVSGGLDEAGYACGE